jgi:3-hydroxyisobutyrate dehydrogenase-like beta-hydroxyacid dehydrogenase
MTAVSIGFIGLGVMGEPICRNLKTRGGHRILVHDLDSAPVERLKQHGAEVASDIGAAVRDCEVAFASLPSGKLLAEVAHGANGLLEKMRPGQIFVDLGTSPVGLTRQLAAEFSERGVAYLDAPVARTRQAAEAGTLSVMVGGPEKGFAKIKPLLACFATDITHCGATGSGQATKILNNMVLFQTVAALAEAHAIAVKTGFDPTIVFQAMSKGSGDSFALRNHGVKAILPQEFPLRAFSVEYAKKDLVYALELAAECGIDAGGARHVSKLFDQAIEEGFAKQYFPIVSRVINGDI